MLISQVELPVSDAVQAARFYGDVLGMLIRRLAASWRSGSGCPCCRSAWPGGAGRVPLRSDVPEDRFAEAKAWLEERVPLLERDGLDEFTLGPPWNSQSVYFAGPDGILLELIARHDLPAVASSGRFSSADLLRISESDLPSRDVPAAVATLQDAFGLPVFGTAAAEFTPLGDPDGLLIVVRQGRLWFPTTTVTPSLGPIAVTVELPSAGKSVTLTANCQVKAG